MAETYEVQALEKIATEIDESKIKVILSTQCIKAQAFLIDKLKQRAERSKETCSFISNANFKLQFEITLAQQEIKSLLIAQDTIKMANVELKKEWLLAKERKNEIVERVKTGEKKYEKLWMESKARYESLPFVRKLLKAKDEVQNLEQKIIELENEEKTLMKEIGVRRETCLQLDRKRIIELAEFMVTELPKTIKIIQEKSVAISDLINELENINLKENVNKEEPMPLKEKTDHLKKNIDWPLAEDNNDDSFLIMPKLQFSDLDFDILSVKLDEVKTKRVDHFSKSPEKNKRNSISLMEVDVSRNLENPEYISAFFNKPGQAYEKNKTQNYAKMKLINILEDIKIDENEAQKMVAKINPDALQSVDSISVHDKNTDEACGVRNNNEDETFVEIEDIEEIDITGSNSENLLIPPTQFLDTSGMQMSQKEQHCEKLVKASTSKEIINLSQTSKSSQEEIGKKKVSFDLLSISDNNAEKHETAEETGANETLNSQMDISAVSDDGFAKIKDLIMKKHNLDLSPKFVYAKNIMTPLNLQKPEDAVVTSKFFQHNETNSNADKTEKVTVNDEQVLEINKIAENEKDTENEPVNQSKHELADMNVEDDNVNLAPSPKRQKINEMPQSDKPVSGFLFSHGTKMIPDSLDVSMSTTGYEDGDGDFPHCIDSSLLLSPKADIPMSTGENPEIRSQGVPNFLSGLRKTGFSFFGHLSSSESKPDSSAQNQGSSGFSFNFGGEEKKNRAGLFSMFQ